MTSSIYLGHALGDPSLRWPRLRAWTTSILMLTSVATLTGCLGSSGGSDSGANNSSNSTASTDADEPKNSVILTWQPPDKNSDGSTLTDLAGFNIYYGSAAGNYSKKLSVPDPSAKRFVVPGLPPGTYYFSVSAYDQNNTEGVQSNPARLTVQ